MAVLRDVFRRRGRSILTIIGIAVGVFALVVLGAVAENDNVYVQRLTGYYSGVVTVIDAQDANFVGMANGNRPLLMDMRAKLEAYPGVKAAYPDANTLLADDYVSAIPPMVLSVTPGMLREYVPFKVAQGRELAGTEHRETLLGRDLATSKGLKVGDTMDIRGTKFTVVGVMARTYVNLIDSAALVPLADAQQLYYQTLPKAYQKGVKPQDLAVQYSVHTQPGVSADELATKLERDFADIKATGPTEMMDTVGGLVGLLNAVVLSIAALALVVCTLSVVNTMTMSVGERTREIGVKRALGASRWRVARDVLAESALLGALGGTIGLVFGAATVAALNSAMVASTGTSALLMTWRLAVAAIGLAVLLGLFGGLWPARHASRLDPATAIAYE
jgi:putative ABC transport system permease protein